MDQHRCQGSAAERGGLRREEVGRCGKFFNFYQSFCKPLYSKLDGKAVSRERARSILPYSAEMDLLLSHHFAITCHSRIRLWQFWLPIGHVRLLRCSSLSAPYQSWANVFLVKLLFELALGMHMLYSGLSERLRMLLLLSSSSNALGQHSDPSTRNQIPRGHRSAAHYLSTQ